MDHMGVIGYPHSRAWQSNFFEVCDVMNEIHAYTDTPIQRPFQHNDPTRHATPHRRCTPSSRTATAACGKGP